MIDLVLAGGPCAGHYGNVKAAPRTLRAVRGAGGQLAILDLESDRAQPDEAMHVYVVDDRTGVMFFDGRYADGKHRGWRTITYRYLGPVNPENGDVAELLPAVSETMADEWHRAQARRFFLDGPGAERVPAHVRDRLEQGAAAAAAKPASPQGHLF